ncbi:MAG: flagellar biosynthesis protein FlgL [Novosphingobium sp.]|nr:flagellar biosynthesis protein FlgL [Novosphingobium sp.]MCP5401068.1 flagellar biosynthesis protein FlgL [Novosphingobium sp.]
MIVNNSTSAFYDRSILGMTDLRKQAESLQQQLDHGQRLTRSSDDPVAASRLRMLSRVDLVSNIDKTNAERANSDLTLADTAMTSFADYINRIKELALQAGNETLTDAQRASLGVEISNLHDDLVVLANSRDSTGHALFGGQAGGDAYTIDGSGNAVYIGTATSGDLPLGDGQTVTRSLTGPEFLNFDLGGSPTGLLPIVKALGEALQGGVPDPAAAARDSLAGLTAAHDAVISGQTLVGARLSWIDMTTERRIDMSELRATEQSNIGGTDIAETIARLQELSLVLEASQASFAKLAQLTLFNQV